jgi:hypothetical protein
MSSQFDIKLAVKRVAYFQTVCPDFIIVLYNTILVNKDVIIIIIIMNISRHLLLYYLHSLLGKWGECRI